MSPDAESCVQRVEGKLDALCDSFREHCQKVEADHKEIRAALYGDGSEGKGLSQRVTKLETSRDLLMWGISALGLSGTGFGAWILSKMGEK